MESESDFFIRLPKSSRIIFLHHTPQLGIPVEMVQFLTKLLLKQNSCAPRFPFSFRCYKIIVSQTSFTLCRGVGNFGKVGVGHFTSDSATLCGNLLFLPLYGKVNLEQYFLLVILTQSRK